jgi:hypothetical protein
MKKPSKSAEKKNKNLPDFTGAHPQRPNPLGSSRGSAFFARKALNLSDAVQSPVPGLPVGASPVGLTIPPKDGSVAPFALDPLPMSAASQGKSEVIDWLIASLRLSLAVFFSAEFKLGTAIRRKPKHKSTATGLSKDFFIVVSFDRLVGLRREKLKRERSDGERSVYFLKK